MTRGSRLTQAELDELPTGEQTVAGKTSLIDSLIVIWGIAGVALLLGTAVVRLASISINAFGFTLSASHWLVLIVSIFFMAYAEGYKTFQRVWAPRVVERAFELKDSWTPITALLAPLYCMSFFSATRKRMLTAWITTACIVLMVILMNRIAQPWRGLIDAGVVVALTWGVLSLLGHSINKIRRRQQATAAD